MYNQTTRSYTMEDGTGSYTWIVEGLDVKDYQTMTDEEIYAWIDREIENVKERAFVDLEESLSSLSFPRMGYTTAQVFEDVEEYEAFKRAEIEEDLKAEREVVFNFIKLWISENSEAGEDCALPGSTADQIR
jgi:hypothetical protein